MTLLKRVRRLLAASLMVLVGVGCTLPASVLAAHQEPRAIVRVQDSPGSAYDALVQRLKNGDPTVDFTELRFAYADSPSYKPYGEIGDAEAMFTALQDKRYAEALEEAEAILGECYVDIDVHMISAIAHRETGSLERAKHHRRIADGLIQSILDSGDGKAPETALTVITVREEYIILNVLGLRPGKQSLVGQDGHRYDHLEATDLRTNKKVGLYFNVDRPLGWFDKQFKK